MYRKYEFEEGIHESLDCVPLTVRRKLDLARLKISLEGWQKLARADRLALCHLPVDGEGDLGVYVEVLRGFAGQAGVPLLPLPDSGRPWVRPTPPDAVSAAMADLGIGLDARFWERLPEDDRYALCKLAAKQGKLALLLRELGAPVAAPAPAFPEAPCSRASQNPSH